MRRCILIVFTAAVLSSAVSIEARAAGWQGGDHSILRDGFNQGWALRRLWDRLDKR